MKRYEIETNATYTSEDWADFAQEFLPIEIDAQGSAVTVDIDEANAETAEQYLDNADWCDSYRENKAATTQIIEEKLEEFGLENINDDTAVCVNKNDLTDVSVFDSEFNTFTKAHATQARYLVDFDDDVVTINERAIQEFVERECN